MVEYYIQELLLSDSNHHYSGWFVDDDVAYRLGIPSPQQSPACYFKANASQNVWERMKENTGWFEDGAPSKFIKLEITPGHYFPRMARTTANHPYDHVGYYPASDSAKDVIAISTSQLLTLTSQLETICQTVHPQIQTLNTYGHNIRNLLILACTEVEAQWSAVLKANSYPVQRLSTNDYVKLAKPMRLNEYSIRFPLFPWLEPVIPFENWRMGGNPTSDLEWLVSYNKVKHNREEEFERATLKHAFEALAACYVMLVAQFGASFRGPFHHSQLSFFELASQPRWPLSEVYSHPNAYALKGTPSNDWMPTNFCFP
jgi:hypothetical protein